MNKRQEPPSNRTLDKDIPELKPYLTPSAKVLDVGCGPGTITLGVADAVNPGEVVGIDPGEGRVDVAREWAAQVGHPGNVTFQVGYSHRLAFPDNTFDVVYSHTALHFFLDPVRGLEEQKRVTVPGGWVIASGVRDFHISHPHCPHWEKVYDAHLQYWVSNLAKYKDSHQDPLAFMEEQRKRDPGDVFYYDMQAGRKCPEWFHQARFQEVRIEIQPRWVKHQGPDGMQWDILDLLVLGEPERDGEKLIVSVQERMIAQGVLDEGTLERAKKEARVWYESPGAFRYWPEVFAAGRA